MIRTSVVILNYNGKEYLSRFLSGVVQHSRGASVVVADNASTDGSAEYVISNFPSVQLIAFDKNYGYTGGYNRAVKQVDADLLVLLNSDVEVTTGWLDSLLTSFDQDATLAAAQPKILSFTQRNTFDYAGAAGGFLDSLGYPYCRGRIFSTLEKDEGQYDEPADVFWASGACLFIRKEVFVKAGGFDEDFFAHMEEIDLCWRIRKLGLTIRCMPKSVVYHVGGGTLSRLSTKKTYLNFRNSLSMLVKNSQRWDLLWKLPVRSLLDLLALLKFLLEGSPGHAAAVVKAQARFWLGIGKDIRKRDASTHPTRMSSGSVVFEYYLRGKKKFADLRV